MIQGKVIRLLFQGAFSIRLYASIFCLAVVCEWASRQGRTLYEHAYIPD